MISTEYSRDAIERRRLLDRAAKAFRDGRLDSNQFQTLTERHERIAAPVGYCDVLPQVNPQVRKVQRSLFAP